MKKEIKYKSYKTPLINTVMHQFVFLALIWLRLPSGDDGIILILLSLLIIYQTARHLKSKTFVIDFDTKGIIIEIEKSDIEIPLINIAYDKVGSKQALYFIFQGEILALFFSFDTDVESFFKDRQA
jgi:hypothetical protein